MDSFNLNLDELARETFELGRQMSFEDFGKSSDFIISKKNYHQKELSIWESLELEDSASELGPVVEFDPIEQIPVIESHIQIPELPVVHVEEVRVPEGPGLIFKIERTSGTFCIRAMAASEIATSLEKLLDGDEKLLEKMKIDEAIFDELYFFETQNLDRAEIIVDQMANRRFPLDEDVLCNISDPGFSWWMSLEEGGFKIYFNSHGLNRAKRFMQLGPLGDGSIAALRFSQLEKHLRNLFAIESLKANDKAINLKALNKEDRAFYQFQAIFTDGVGEDLIEDLARTPEGRTLYYYLQEIADLRRFWLVIDNTLYSS